MSGTRLKANNQVYTSNLVVDKKVYEAYKKVCKKRGFKIIATLDRILEQGLKNFVTKMEVE